MNTTGSVSFELRNNLSELATLSEKMESVGQALNLSRRCLFEMKCSD